MSAPEKVSFTIRRPTPISRATSSGADSDAQSSNKLPALPRHLVNSNDSAPGSPLARSATSSPKPNGRGSYYTNEQESSDEDEEVRDELVTGFDRFGVQRKGKDRSSKATPLVIPALQNRDWRDLARKRRSAAQFVPQTAKAGTGADGSVGGLGTRDSVNTGSVISGLQLKTPAPFIKREEEEQSTTGIPADVKMKEDVEEDDEDKQAIRAILAGTYGAETDGPTIDVIPVPISEAEAYKQDVEELPEPATLDDYSRVPVSQFGAALLRGMGWKEGTAATRQPGKGLVEPYLPAARPALLGIGAKEREVLDDGSGKPGGKLKRPERRYVPVVKKEREDRPALASDSRERRRERSRSPRLRNGTHASSSRRSPRERDGERDSRRREMSDKPERDGNRKRDPLPDDRDRGRTNDAVRDRRRDRSRDTYKKRRD